MFDHSAVALCKSADNMGEIAINDHDKNILRELAKKLADLAGRDTETAKRDLWYAHNDLHDVRPLIFCDPENGWNEIIRQEDIKCEGELARNWEMVLRKEVFWGESMNDDRVTQDYFDVSYVAVESDWGMHEKKIGGEDGGSYIWESPLQDYADLDKLHFPTISIDNEKSAQLMELAHELFDGILTVRRKNAWWWTLGMTWTLVNIRGLEQVMFDLYDYPDELHKLMSILRDGTLNKLDFLEKNGLLFPNNDGTYVGSGGFGWTKSLPSPGFEGKLRTIDMWGFGESQETGHVSPDNFKEFIFQYQLPILERFGLNCYGCCEPMDKRWDIVKRIPRLRRVSISAWADFNLMAELLGRDYVFSYKPNPAYLAQRKIDAAYIEKSLRESVQRARQEGCHMEIIMKDNHTLGGNPNNVVEWCSIAKKVIDDIYS